MKLEKPITLIPSKTTNQQTNEVVSPPPITLEELLITYINYPPEKQYYIGIQQIPMPIMLFQGEEYREDIQTSEAREKLIALAEGDLEAFLQKTFPRTLEDDPYGPGSILASMFSAIGIKSTPTCSCRRHALEMNNRGIEWCENNMDTILGWLKEECEKRSIPWVETVARMVVNRAITKSKKYREAENA